MNPPITQVIVAYLVGLFQQIRTSNGCYTNFGASVTAEDKWFIWDDTHLDFGNGIRRAPLVIAEDPEQLHSVLEQGSAVRVLSRSYIAQAVMAVTSGKERKQARELEDDMLSVMPWDKCFPDTRIQFVKAVQSGFQLLEEGSGFAEVTLKLQVEYRRYKNGPAGA